MEITKLKKFRLTGGYAIGYPSDHIVELSKFAWPPWDLKALNSLKIGEILKSSDPNYQAERVE